MVQKSQGQPPFGCSFATLQIMGINYRSLNWWSPDLWTHQQYHMGVSKNRGVKPPKWMVKIMEIPMNKWMIWGVFTHYFRKHPYTLQKFNMEPENGTLQ